VATDIVAEKVDMINRRQSPIADREITEYMNECRLDLRATLDAADAYRDAEYVVVCTPTNYDKDRNYFDTGSVEAAVEAALSVNPKAVIVIKSTIPIGYTRSLREKHPGSTILFSPEFLREGRALYDNLYPSRIIVGVPQDDEAALAAAHRFANLLAAGAMKQDIPMLFPGLTEAESIKLFANTYLALRVSFFNELDTFAETMGLNPRQIIEGVGMDARIGLGYNNPSFGYGGYCLPKDTRQLLANYDGIPQKLMGAIVEANAVRKEYVAQRIWQMAENHADDRQPVIGIYRLIMKEGSDNFRQSSVCDVMALLNEMGARIVIYEHTLKEDVFNGYEVEHNLNEFKQMTDVIVANRSAGELNDVKDKLYTRDLYQRD